MDKNFDDRVNREKEWYNRHAGKSFDGKLNSPSITYKLIDRMDMLVLEELKNTQKSILDYGCGGKDFLIRNANLISEGVGIDIFDTQIEKLNKIVKERSIQNISFMVMDAMTTSFKDNSFDVIRGQAILHHLDLERSLIEIKRFLFCAFSNTIL